HSCREDEVQHRGSVLAGAVAVAECADELVHGDLEPGLLAHLAMERGERVLLLLEKAPDRVPQADVGLECTTREEQATPAVDDEGGDGRQRVRVADESARRALDLRTEMRQVGCAARTEAPARENRHAGTVLPCLRGTSRRP